MFNSQYSGTPFDRPPLQKATTSGKATGQFKFNINVLVSTPDERGSTVLVQTVCTK